MDLNKCLAKYIRKLKHWVSVRMLVRKLMLCLPAGAAAAFAVELTAYFKPWMRVHVWAAAAIGVSAVTALIWWFMRRPDAHAAALALDRTGLKERTITALELLDDDSFFAEIQKKDAWDHLSGVKLRKRLPIAVSRKNIGLFAAFCAAFVVCAAAPSPAKEEAKLQYQVSKAAKEEAEKIEETAEELEEKTAAGELTEEENEAIQELFAQLQEELSEVQTQEDLEKALERAAYKLSEAKSETDNLSVQESVEQLAQALDTEKGSDSDLETLSKTEELAETTEELLEHLEDADIRTLSEEELKELAETLEALAQAADDSSLAQQLSEAAASAASGQLTAEQIAAALSAASSVKQQTQTLLAAAGDLDANSSISSKSSSGTSENNSGGSGSSGSGNENGNGSGSGSGNGDGNGNGNGSGDGTGGGWNYGSKNGTEENASYSGEIVSVPDTVGDDENLTGEAGDGTTYSSTGFSLMWSGNRITYDQVIGSYTEQAMSEIESANYPGGLQDLIKSYFSDLNGE